MIQHIYTYIHTHKIHTLLQFMISFILTFLGVSHLVVICVYIIIYRIRAAMKTFLRFKMNKVIFFNQLFIIIINLCINYENK